MFDYEVVVLVKWLIGCLIEIDEEYLNVEHVWCAMCWNIVLIVKLMGYAWNWGVMYAYTECCMIEWSFKTIGVIWWPRWMEERRKSRALIKANLAFAIWNRSREIRTELTIPENGHFALANYSRSCETKTEPGASDAFAGKAISLSRTVFALAKLVLTWTLNFESLNHV